MTWYKTGTVQVTAASNAVVGTSTTFIDDARVGDAFSGPDGNWYEIVNIVSDTTLAIFPPYRGASTSGGSYVIAPMQGYVKESADALREASRVIGQVGTDVSAQVQQARDAATAAKASEIIATDAATLSTSNKNAAVTAANTATNASTTAVSARDEAVTAKNAAQASANAAAQSAADAAAVTVGKAQSGANSDITSLSGLTTPLSISQGGTGSNTGVPTYVGATASANGVKGLVPAAPIADRLKVLSGAGTWVALPTGGTWGAIGGTLSSQTDLQAALDAKYGKNNILGTVSQAGGVPTGAIIERGSNTNGEYVKYADGTMVCTGVSASSLTTGTSTGGGTFFSPASIMTFPVAFSATPRVSLSCTDAVSNFCWICSDVGTVNSLTTTNNFRAASFSGTASTKVSYIAIGRWF